MGATVPSPIGGLLLGLLGTPWHLMADHNCSVESGHKFQKKI